MAQTLSNIQQIDSKLENLKYEVQTLRSFLASMIGKDKEGNYNPKFVKEMLKAAKETPTHSFRNAKTLLKTLREK